MSLRQVKQSLLLVTVLILNLPAHAQLGTGTLNGTITDAGGAVIPSASLTLVDTGTNATRTFKAGNSGHYSVPELPIGRYRLTATAPGFGKLSKDKIEMSVGAQLTVDFALPVGEVSSTVEVQASSQSEVNSTSGEQSTLIDPKQISDLPLNGRNFQQLVLLAPGAQASPEAPQNSVVGRSPAYSISGSRPDGGAVLLDGANTQGFFDRGTGASIIGTSLGVEAIAEFQVLTGIYGAQFGGNGSVINAVTKSGTNQVHGTVYDFVRNSVFDARNYFDALGSVPSFRRNQFGGSVGLPIVKDKTFLFANYEGLRQQLGASYTSTVPDAMAHNGYVPCAAASATCVNGYTYVGVSPTIAPFFALFPVPNLPGNAGSGVGQYRFVADNPANEDYVNTRLDQVFSPKDTFSARYLSDNGSLIDPVPGGLLPGFPEVSLQRNRYATFENKYIKSTRLLNVTRFHFVRTAQAARQVTQNPADSFLQFSPGQGYGTVVIQSLVPAGAVTTNVGAGSTTALHHIQNLFSVQDDVFTSVKSHQIQAGIDVSRVQSNVSLPIYQAVQYQFTTVAAFLTATPLLAIEALPGSDPVRDSREIDVSPYVQDDWKVTPRLSVNLGVRYDFVSNPVETRDKLYTVSNYATATGFTQVPHVFASNPSLKNVDPRFGFSYLPSSGNSKTAVRGGFGIFHDDIKAKTYLNAYQISPPYNFHVTVFPTFPNPFATAAQGLPTLIVGIPYNTTNTPTQMQYSLGIQQQMDSSTVLTVSYVGNQGRHLFLARDLNPVLFQICPCSDPANPAAASLPAGTQYQPVGYQRGNPHFGAVTLSPATGTSHYNSLQTSLVRQLSHGVQFQVSYTWAKTLDYGSIESGAETMNGSDALQNFNNVREDYGPAAFDIRHVGTANLIYAFPGRRRNLFLSGWEGTLLTQFRTGTPYNVLDGFDQAEVNNNSINERPNQIGNPNRPGQVPGNPTCIAPTTVHNAAHYYNPCAFALQPQGTFGNEGRDDIFTQGFEDVDLGIVKNTTVHESVQLELRGELFNILNHTNLGFPNLTLFTPGATNSFAGSITNTIGTSRQAQLSFKVLF